MARKAKSRKARSKKASPKKVDPVPRGFPTVTSHIVVRDAANAIEFYKKAFGAKELHRMNMPDGRTVLHAMLKIGDTPVMLADEFPQSSTRSPQSIGGTSVGFYTYVKDVDKFFERAVAAGATVTMPVMDAFWGDRTGTLTDPFGHSWSIATHKRDLSPKQMQQAQDEWLASMKPQA
jgi:uncharacterized glyoxalase superfamily protein PhnB